MNIKNCSNCKKEFSCANPGACWCSDFPQIMPLDSADDCLCKDCLIEIQNEKITTFIDNKPLNETLKFAAEFYNPDNLIENFDYTVEKEKWVFTQWFLLKRGFCCDSGCRNCPYKA